MPGFRVHEFKGFLPIYDSRKLPAGHGVEAIDCDLKASDLRVYHERTLKGSISSNDLYQRSGFVFNENQIFAWANEVSACFGPIQYENENENKVFIDSGWLGYPVYTTKNIGIPGNPDNQYYGPPVNHYKLGVPAPDGTLLLSASPTPAGQVLNVRGADITLADGETVIEDATVCDCENAHNLEEGNRIVLSGFNWNLLNNTYIVSLLSEHEANREKSFILRGVVHSELEANSDTDTHPDSGSGAWVRDYTDVEQEDRIYVFTYVTQDGEEGPPSPPSELITIGPDQSVTITFPAFPGVDGVPVDTVRIYRTLPTSTGAADYYFVDEVLVSEGEYVDAKKPIELGEMMISLEWDPPPDGLIGFVNLPNGVIIGWKDNTIYMCEPYQPHAWPQAYTKQIDHKVVGIAAYGQSVIVTTDDAPYTGTLTDPLSMTFSKSDTVEPCLSRRACISAGYGALYPSPNGLILATREGARNVLNGIWDEKKWRSMFIGREVFANIHDGRYYLTFSEGLLSDTLIFNPQETPLQITQLSEGNYNGGVVDRDADKLFYFGSVTEPYGPKVYLFDPDLDETRIPARWKSQTFVMPMPLNMGAAQVFYDESMEGTLEIDFIADGIVRFTKTVADQEPFRLPSGFLAREWAIEVRTTVDVQSVFVTETIDELVGAMTR